MEPTQKQVDNEIEKLKKQKEELPEHSAFGDPNWKIIDLQIEILKSNIVADTAIGTVLEAFDFLKGEIDSLTD